jgi:hypothetical protein
MMTVLMVASLAAIFVVDSPCSSAGSVINKPEVISKHLSYPYSLLDAFTLHSQPLGQLAEDIQVDVKGCMASNGWSYWIPTYITFNSEYTTLGSFWNYRSHEGYGASTQVIFEATHRLIPVVSDFKYLARLTSSQRTQYWLTLTGSSNRVGDFLAIPLTIPSKAASGCEARARRAVLKGLPYFQLKLRKAIIALYSDQNNRGEVVAATSKWEGCMRKAGFPVTTFDEEESDFLRKANDWSLKMARSQFGHEIKVSLVDATCFLNYLYPALMHVDDALLMQFASIHPSDKMAIQNLINKYPWPR